MKTPTGVFEVGFNHGDDPIAVVEEVGIETKIKFHEDVSYYQKMSEHVVDAVIKINERDNEENFDNNNNDSSHRSGYQNGARTKTKSQHCNCGFKHWYFGKEKDFVLGFPGHGTEYLFGFDIGDEPQKIIDDFFECYPYLVKNNDPIKDFITLIVSKYNKKHGGIGAKKIAEEYNILCKHKPILLCGGSENASKFIERIKFNYEEATNEKLTNVENEVLMKLCYMIGKDFKDFSSKEMPTASFLLVDKLLRKLPNNKLYPCIDMLRFLVTHPTVLNYCIANNTLFSSVLNRCCKEGSDPIAHMMALRMVANFTANDRGASFMARKSLTLAFFEDILISVTNETSKQYIQSLQAIVAILHNLSPFMKKKKILKKHNKP